MYIYKIINIAIKSRLSFQFFYLWTKIIGVQFAKLIIKIDNICSKIDLFE
jgi:hypothetical protein